jgi:hypothetical protein
MSTGPALQRLSEVVPESPKVDPETKKEPFKRKVQPGARLWATNLSTMLAGVIVDFQFFGTDVAFGLWGSGKCSPLGHLALRKLMVVD